MKVAVISARHKSWSKYCFVTRALIDLGYDAVMTSGDRNQAQLLEAWADIAIWEPKFLQNFATENIGFVSGCDRRCLRACWMFDLVVTDASKPMSEQPLLWVHDGQKLDQTPLLAALRCCNVAFVKERSMLDGYADVGVIAEWLDQGCPSSLAACEHREKPRWDVLVIGTTRWRQRRQDVLALVNAGLRVAWAVPKGDGGVGQGIEYLPYTPVDQLPALMSDAAVLFDCGLRSDVDGYWSDKLWLALGMGACHIRRWSPGLPGPRSGSLLYSTYKTPGEAVRGVRELVEQPERRRLMGAAARRWTMRYHTYQKRCKELVKRCEARMESVGSAAVAAV